MTLYDQPSRGDYGFTALPADTSKPAPSNPNPKTVPVSQLQPPSSPLADRVHAYAKAAYNDKTFNHCMRVYSYGLAIARECYPEWKVAAGSKLEETWFLTAMLHDIGTTEGNLAGTRLSFEFWGGYHALELLQRPSVSGHGEGEAVADREQAESVAEAIIRHQDVQDKGSVTLVTRLIHLGTLLDNVGANGELVAGGTIEEVCRAYGREGWSGCFKGVVEREKREKPYAMVSRIEGFEGMIEANTGKEGLMEGYE